MGNNNRPVTTETRSVSFDRVMFEFMEQDRQELRLDRSQYLRELIERRYEQKHHKAAPAIAEDGRATATRNGIPLFPKTQGAGKATLSLVKRLRDEAP
jgi:hypothetical protein